MLSDLVKILKIREIYKESVVKSFESELLDIEFPDEPMQKMETIEKFNNLYFKHFKKSFLEENKNSLDYLKFLIKYSLNAEDVNSLKINNKEIKKEIKNFKDEYDSIKHELPQKLMFIYQLFNNCIFKNDGSTLTPREYANSSSFSFVELEKFYADSVALINQKTKRLDIKKKVD